MYVTAISLEWDQQPHYLEASLMMKGYSAAEAQVAAERARSLPPRRVEPRPPLAATAYATTRDKVHLPLYLTCIMMRDKVRRVILATTAYGTIKNGTLHTIISLSLSRFIIKG